MTVNREIVEGVMEQGVDEEVVYTLTTTPWGSSPATVVVKVFSYIAEGYTDVTTTVMPAGSPTVNGDVITLPMLKSLTLGTRYRVEVKFTCSGNIFEPYAWIQCRR